MFHGAGPGRVHPAHKIALPHLHQCGVDQHCRIVDDWISIRLLVAGRDHRIGGHWVDVRCQVGLLDHRPLLLGIRPQSARRLVSPSPRLPQGWTLVSGRLRPHPSVESTQTSKTRPATGADADEIKPERGDTGAWDAAPAIDCGRGWGGSASGSDELLPM